jgi:hypothetical protein
MVERVEHGDVESTRVEIEWEGQLWEVDIEATEGEPLRLALFRTKANSSREHVQAAFPPQDPLSLETVHGWLADSGVPHELTRPLAERVLQARSGLSE